MTDNGSNFKKAGEFLMKDQRYTCFWTPCVAHYIDLILKDFGKIKVIQDFVSDVRSITTFIYNHGHVLSIMRGCCKGDLVRPGITRFATNFIALRSLLDNKVGLKHMVTTTELNRNKKFNRVLEKKWRV